MKVKNDADVRNHSINKKDQMLLTHHLALALLLGLIYAWITSVDQVHATAVASANTNTQPLTEMMWFQQQNDEKKFEYLESNGLFEGDILTTKEQIAKRYGDDAANKAEVLGMLRKAKELGIKNNNDDGVVNSANHDKNNNDRDLGLISNFNKVWNIRDVDTKVIVPYEILSTMPSAMKALILQAFKVIEEKTGCITFKPKTDKYPDWILFQNTDDGCYSAVGRVGGRQIINITTRCPLGSIIHEIFHSLGMFHEQSRSDRDDYVTILWENIQKDKEGNFAKEMTNNLGVPYDYKSIMHYFATAFGISGVVCTQTEKKNNTVATISFYDSNAATQGDYCITIENGNFALNDEQSVAYRSCGENKYKSQYWIIESYKFGYNVIRAAQNPSYCLTIESSNPIHSDARAMIKKCNEGTFNNQLFTFDQQSWDVTILRWGEDYSYAITRNTTPSSSKVYSIKLDIIWRETFAYQPNAIRFVQMATNRPGATINSYCRYGTLPTIDARGNQIGFTTPSDRDILQLQLLYQCPSGPRYISNFCSQDCKCKENQGACKSDDDCQSGLVCYNDGNSISKCIRNPNNMCKYTTQKSCAKDTHCQWAKVGNNSKCVLFDCNNLKSSTTCSKFNKNKCQWSSTSQSCARVP